jgi:hypothetical protein
MPIYLECKGDVVILHPEGHQLTKNDFIASSWPGNPLAAVLRATREFQNDRARKAGQPEPPDPYPLIIVRPSGLKSYLWARSAISAWDSDYGYEFVDEDMKLAFPMGPDPQLAQVQHHALLIARERLLHMVQSAPSRFPGFKMTGGSPYGGGGNGMGAGSYGAGGGGGNGMSSGGESLGSQGGTDDTAFNSMNSGGNGMGGNGANGEMTPANDSTANGQEGPHLGEYQGDPNSKNGSASGANTSGTAQGGAEGGDAEGQLANGTANPNGSDAGPRYGQQNANGSPTNAPSEPLDGRKSVGSGQKAGGSSGSGGSNGSSGGGPGSTAGSGFSSSSQSESISASRGSNWAVDQPRQKSVAIRRTIHVVVRENQMILLPGSYARRNEGTGEQISLDQPVEKISDEFAAAVKDRIDDWGLAGSGMYWRPVLVLNVEQNSHMTAARITQLLDDSGVEVQMPETANSSSSPAGGSIR